MYTAQCGVWVQYGYPDLIPARLPMTYTLYWVLSYSLTFWINCSIHPSKNWALWLTILLSGFFQATCHVRRIIVASVSRRLWTYSSQRQLQMHHPSQNRRRRVQCFENCWLMQPYWPSMKYVLVPVCHGRVLWMKAYHTRMNIDVTFWSWARN